MRRARLSVVAVGLAAVAALSGRAPAVAASCAGIAVAPGLSFAVSSTTVPEGGCVRFTNVTGVRLTITVADTSYRAVIGANASTGSAAAPNFVARAVGAFRVTATDGLRTGHGTITVTKPKPTPSPTRSPSPRPSTHPSASPSASAHSRHRTHHRATPHRRGHGHRRHGGLPPPISVSLPPLPTGSTTAAPGANPKVAPGLPAAGGAVDPHAAVQSGPIEPVSGDGAGLPAAVAALLVLGVGAGVGRAVLARADGGATVDDERRDDGGRP
ncbi:MAG TPA: hypothetical protein VG708_03340 [Mycobacteriales bacterium]|jgi:hypothetical protein|nr:hypothetical protein [Mycobacteriales bacterium]